MQRHDAVLQSGLIALLNAERQDGGLERSGHRTGPSDHRTPRILLCSWNATVPPLSNRVKHGDCARPVAFSPLPVSPGKSHSRSGPPVRFFDSCKAAVEPLPVCGVGVSVGHSHLGSDVAANRQRATGSRPTLTARLASPVHRAMAAMKPSDESGLLSDNDQRLDRSSWSGRWARTVRAPPDGRCAATRARLQAAARGGRSRFCARSFASDHRTARSARWRGVQCNPISRPRLASRRQRPRGGGLHVQYAPRSSRAVRPATRTSRRRRPRCRQRRASTASSPGIESVTGGTTATDGSARALPPGGILTGGRRPSRVARRPPHAARRPPRPVAATVPSR